MEILNELESLVTEAIEQEKTLICVLVTDAGEHEVIANVDVTYLGEILNRVIEKTKEEIEMIESGTVNNEIH